MLNSAYIEIDNYCNSKCIYCYNNIRSNEQISLNDFEKMICKLKEIGIKCIILTGGEPTLHPNLMEFLNILKKNNMIVGMSTNGIKLNDKIIDFFAENKSFIQVSIDSTDREIYKKIRKTDTLDIATNNIRKMLSKEINVDAGIVLNNLSLVTLEQTIYDLSDMGIPTMHIEEIKDVGFATDNFENLYIKDFFEVLKRLYKIEQKIYPKSSIGMIEDILLRCVNNSCSNSCCNCMEGNMMQIDLYGHIYHCKNQGKQSYVGNIFKDDIDIIKKDVKDFKLSFDKTECKECQYGYICRGGCRTKIYAKQKSLYGKGTRCQEMYKLIEMIIKDKEDGKLDQLLFQIQLSYEFNSMNGFLKWV